MSVRHVLLRLAPVLLFYGQVVAAQATTLMKVSEFAVPDAPAMKLLSVSDGAILRPQSFGTLAVGLSGFRGDEGQFVVPKEFGVEFSPTLLATRSDATYSPSSDLLARMRLSIAARRDSGGQNALAFGLRYSVFDDASQGYSTELAALADTVNRLLDSTRVLLGPNAPLTLSVADELRVAALRDQMSKRIAEDNWNANAMHFAIAARAFTADTLGTEATIDEIAAWGTMARALGQTGQLLLGAQAGSARDTTGSFVSEMSLAGRVYLGSNGGKAFVEGSLAMREEARAASQFTLGLEFQVPSLGWVDASWGVERTNGATTRTVSSVKFKRSFSGI